MVNNKTFFPRISTEFCSRNAHQESHQNSAFHANHALYTDALRNILQNILPKDFFLETTNDVASLQKTKKALHELLPLLSSCVWSEKPFKMSFFTLFKYRSNAFRFFFEMISHWLIPGKRLNVLLMYAADFTMPDLSSTVYTVCEVVIQLQNKEEHEQILRNLPIIEAEVRLGMESAYYARRILEVKGLSADEKTALIQEHIARLAEKLPNDFDQDVLTEMQHFLVMCNDDFKAARDCQLLSRIISIHYLFRKNLKKLVKETPLHRHLSLKLIRSTIHVNSKPKKVLGISMGINFLKDKEIFEKKHFLNAILACLPNVLAVEDSFFANRLGQEQICTFYLEIEKEDGEIFTSKEINFLRQELPSHLKDSIEHLMHLVFMPRNEEEIMRNILALSNQLKYLRDIPQGYISFDEQTDANLFFTVILVRILKPSEPYISIQDMFKEKDSFLSYVADRAKKVGMLRNKYPKEATVFRAKIAKEPFLRSDHSINLYEARQAVVLELLRVVGEFRDFNGGIISKQQELISIVKSLLEGNFKSHDLLLENFFYSLNPVIMRTILHPEMFKTLFTMLLEIIPFSLSILEPFHFKIYQEPQAVFILVKTTLQPLKESLNKALLKHSTNSSDFANAYVQLHGIHYMGYIYCSDENQKLQQFVDMTTDILKRS